MAAVMREVPQLGWRELDSLLRYWGNARWRVGLCGGFPSQSSSVGMCEVYEPREWFQPKQITASGRQRPHYGGHRVLYDDAWHVSKTLLMVNMAVHALPEKQYQAVVVAYAIGRAYSKDFSQKEQAEMLETTPDALQERLRRARKKLSQMLCCKVTGAEIESSYIHNSVRQKPAQ